MPGSKTIKKSLFMLLVFISAASFPAPGLLPESAASGNEIMVIGSSRIYNDVSNARKAAVSEGLLSAVETAALGMLPQESLKSGFEDISALLREKRSDFILGYQVLKEVNTGKYYRLLIRATVSEEEIKAGLEGLGITMGPKDMPRVLLLVAEKNAGQSAYSCWWCGNEGFKGRGAAYDSIEKIFREKGFAAAERRELRGTGPAGDRKPVPDISADQALELGSRLNADIVVFGRARAKQTSNTMGGDIKTCLAEVSLAAMDVSTKQKIASVERTDTAADRSTAEGSRAALSRASQLAAEKISEQIIEKWQEQKGAAGPLEIHVKSEGDILGQLVNFRKSLRSTKGVTELQTLERSTGEALLSLKYEGSSRELAEKLLLTHFSGFGIDIYDLNESRISIEIVPDHAISESELD